MAVIRVTNGLTYTVSDKDLDAALKEEELWAGKFREALGDRATYDGEKHRELAAEMDLIETRLGNYTGTIFDHVRSIFDDIVTRGFKHDLHFPLLVAQYRRYGFGEPPEQWVPPPSIQRLDAPPSPAATERHPEPVFSLLSPASSKQRPAERSRRHPVGGTMHADPGTAPTITSTNKGKAKQQPAVRADSGSTLATWKGKGREEGRQEKSNFQLEHDYDSKGGGPSRKTGETRRKRGQAELSAGKSSLSPTFTSDQGGYLLPGPSARPDTDGQNAAEMRSLREDFGKMSGTISKLDRQLDTMEKAFSGHIGRIEHSVNSKTSIITQELHDVRRALEENAQRYGIHREFTKPSRRFLGKAKDGRHYLPARELLPWVFAEQHEEGGGGQLVHAEAEEIEFDDGGASHPVLSTAVAVMPPIPRSPFAGDSSGSSLIPSHKRSQSQSAGNVEDQKGKRRRAE